MAEETGTQEDKPTTLLKLGDLKNLIGDVVDRALSSREEKTDPTTPTPTPPRTRRTPTREPEPRSMKDEVDAAVARLEAEKEERARQAALQKDIEDLKAEKKSREERPPVERRRVHKIMGWGE